MRKEPVRMWLLAKADETFGVDSTGEAIEGLVHTWGLGPLQCLQLPSTSAHAGVSVRSTALRGGGLGRFRAQGPWPLHL